jgi:hypothetical protein
LEICVSHVVVKSAVVQATSKNQFPGLQLRTVVCIKAVQRNSFTSNSKISHLTLYGEDRYNATSKHPILEIVF